MEKTRDSEKSQRFISFHWREEAMLKRRLSSLESMKRQVDVSFSLDQRILLSRFQNKLRRSARARARMATDEALILRLADENIPFNTTPTNDTERSISQLTGATRGHCSGSSGQGCPAVLRGQSSQSACRPPRSVQGRNAKHKPMGAITPEKTRSQSSQPSFRKVTLSPPQHLESSAPSHVKKPITPRPITATVAFQDPQDLPDQPQPRGGESRGSMRESSKDDRQTPATKTVFEPPSKLFQGPPATKAVFDPPSKRLQSLSTKLESQDERAAPTPRSEEAEKHQSADEPTDSGTEGQELAVKVSRFVEKVKNMRHLGSIMSDYYGHRLSKGLSSRKEARQVTEEDHDGWSLVGSERASRSITIQELDSARPAEELPTDLLVLESYSALLTRENREERNWTDNNPYNSSGPSASTR